MADRADTQKLLEMERIRRVYCVYCDALDYKRFDNLAEVFSADCEVDYNDIIPGLIVNGSEAVVSSARAVLGESSAVRCTHHNVGNFRIDVDGYLAKAIVRFYAIHAGAGEWQGQKFSCWGDYHDRLELREGRWQITHRTYLGFITEGPVAIGGYGAA